MVVLIGILWLLDILAFFAAIALLIIRAIKKQPKKPFVIMVVVTFIAFFVLTLLFPGSDDSRENPKSEPTAASDLEDQSRSETESFPYSSLSSSSSSSSLLLSSSSLSSETDSSSITNHLIEVYFSVSVKGIDGKPEFVIDTNLPDGAELMVTLKGEDEYTAQTKVAVENGRATTEAFSNKGNPIFGKYFVDISMGLSSRQADKVRAVIGQKGENLVGQYVETDEITSENWVNASEIFTYESPIPPDTSSSNSNDENDSVTSLENIATAFEVILDGNFDGYEVLPDDAGITVNIWQDGIAMELVAIQTAGGRSDNENWVFVKDNMVEMASSMRRIMDNVDQQNALLVLNLLNDMDHDKTLLSIVNETIIYDVLE